MHLFTQTMLVLPGAYSVGQRWHYVMPQASGSFRLEVGCRLQTRQGILSMNTSKYEQIRKVVGLYNHSHNHDLVNYHAVMSDLYECVHVWVHVC